MATSRRRSSGFTEKPKSEAETEEKEVKESLDAAATELFETISQTEREPVEPVEFVEESIAPSNATPRFVEEPELPPVEAPVLAPRPKLPRRPQRNVPRFSRVR